MDQKRAKPGKRRCKFYGDKATGRRTLEGKTRIAEAQRRRWRRWRDQKRNPRARPIRHLGVLIRYKTNAMDDEQYLV